ncbi:MAG: DegT/DnrJ/EryC1/StrS family aminotransferase [Cyclobacteriaceae bacterium]|nr:DegT/DnrJ/EryC1/StrS family aminotransferase [Cyclobacteriaceae bacterium]
MEALSNKETPLPQEWPGIHYIGEEEVEAVTRILRAKSPFRFYGPDFQQETLHFEEEFAQYIGVKHCLAVSHGTAALQVAMAAMRIGPGDEVLLPGYFWVSTVAAVVRSGAIPRLVDVDPSFNMDPDDLERKISPRTKLAIMVPMGGVIGQVARVAEICKKNNIYLLEDCAQSNGASQFERMAGSYGDMAIFSFQINKNITAGEGGAVLTNNEKLYKKAYAIHDLGYTKDANGELVLDQPEYQLWGIGCRMTEVTAAILRQQLKKLDMIVGNMRGVKNELKEMLGQYSGIKTRHVADPDGDGGSFLKIIFKDHATARQFKDGLITNGICVKEGAFYPILMTEWGLHIYSKIPALVNKRSYSGHHSVWELAENNWARDYSYKEGTLPVLDDYVQRTVLFCVASKLTDGQRSLIKSTFQATCDQMGFEKTFAT